MTKPSREKLERLVTADMRAITARSDRIGRAFARKHGVSYSDFQALLQVFVAETAGSPLTARELSHRMEVSGSAITYFVDRMTASGHVRRDVHPGDRRKVMLRYSEQGVEVARAFFTPLADNVHGAMAELHDRDLAAAHRVFLALIAAMATFEDEVDR